MNRESLIQEISKWQREITDLQDALLDGVPARAIQKITNRIEQLKEMIFSNNQLLEQ